MSGLKKKFQPQRKTVTLTDLSYSQVQKLLAAGFSVKEKRKGKYVISSAAKQFLIRKG